MRMLRREVILPANRFVCNSPELRIVGLSPLLIEAQTRPDPLHAGSFGIQALVVAPNPNLKVEL